MVMNPDERLWKLGMGIRIPLRPPYFPRKKHYLLDFKPNSGRVTNKGTIIIISGFGLEADCKTCKRYEEETGIKGITAHPIFSLPPLEFVIGLNTSPVTRQRGWLLIQKTIVLGYSPFVSSPELNHAHQEAHNRRHSAFTGCTDDMGQHGR